MMLHFVRNESMPYHSSPTKGTDTWWFDEDDLDAWFKDRVNNNPKRDLTELKAANLDLDAAKKEVELAHLVGTLVPIDAVCDQVANDFAKIRARLLQLPHVAAPLVATLDTPAECKIELERLVREVLEELSYDARLQVQVAEVKELERQRGQPS